MTLVPDASSAPTPKSPRYADDVRPQVEQLLNAGHVEAALKHIEEYILDGHEDEEAVADLAVLYHVSNRHSDAQMLLSGYVDTHPNCILARKRLALVELVRGNAPIALGVIEPVLSLAPNDPEALRIVGEIASALKRPDHARSFYVRALAITPGDPELAALLAALPPPSAAPITTTPGRFSDLLALGNFFESVPVPYAILRLSPDFPHYAVNEDIDVLCEDREQLRAHIREVGRRYESQGFRVEETIHDGHLHIDYFAPREQRLNFRFDILDTLSGFHKIKVAADWTRTLLARSQRVTQGGVAISVPSAQDELALRLLEYLEHRDIRPDKVKHLQHVLAAGTTDFLQPLAKYTDLKLSIGNGAVSTDLAISPSGPALPTKSPQTRMDYFLIWGHGLSHTREILEIIRSHGAFDIVAVYRRNVGDMARFVQRVYECDAVPMEHLIAKTKYLLTVPSDVLLVVANNKQPREKYFGEGAFRHIQCQQVKDVKEMIRDRFNPRINGKRTENHVIHASDYESQTEHVLKVMGLPPVAQFRREANSSLLTPHHIQPFTNYLIHEVPIEQLRANILGQGTVTIEATPHYQYARGNRTPYIDYQAKYAGNQLTDDHYPEAFDRLIASYDPAADQRDGKVSHILALRRAEGGFLIIDGVHRAAILAARGVRTITIAEPNFTPGSSEPRPGVGDAVAVQSNASAARAFVKNGLTQRSNGKLESASGPGSSVAAAANAIGFLRKIITEHNVRSILDLGCGDWNWMKEVGLHDLGVHYTGWDIEPGLIADLNANHGRKEIRFEAHDVLQTPLPKVDLVICRDILFHIDVNWGARLVKAINASGTRLFLATSFPGVVENSNIKSYNQIEGWGFYETNLDIAPFQLAAKKVAFIDEPLCKHGNYDRTMALYQLNGRAESIRNPTETAGRADTVWMYWEGAMPTYVDMCIDSIKRNAHMHVELLNQQSVKEWLPDLRPDIWLVREPAHRADYIRARLLHRYGGVWVDADFICLRSLRPLLDEAAATGFACSGAQAGSPSIWLLASSPASKQTLGWIQAMDAILDQKGADAKLDWNELGGLLLASIVASTGYQHIERSNFGWIPWDRSAEIFEPETAAASAFDGYGFALFNKMIGQRLASASKVELLSAPTLLGSLFRRAYSSPLNDRSTAPTGYQASKTCQIPGLAQIYEQYLGFKTDGTFVEVGAFDGEYVSNTSNLADLGWYGHYIEPVPDHAAACRKRHAKNKNTKVFDLAIAEKDGEATIHVGGPLSTMDPESLRLYQTFDWAQGYHSGKVVKTRQTTLDQFLRSAQIQPGFDLLIVDVEGYEWNVFQRFDIAHWQPRMAIVELHDEAEAYVSIRESCLKVAQLFRDHGYRPVFKDGTNTVFLRTEPLRKTS